MKRNYEQPQIEVLDIQIEKGFAQSDGVDMDIDRYLRMYVINVPYNLWHRLVWNGR
mgnify:CR=1 FL=1